MDWKSWHTYRRILLAGVVLGAFVWFSVGGLPEVCSQQLPSGFSVPVEVCKTMPATDPRALLFLLGVGALLLPDLAELEVGGVLKVRRQLDDVKGEATDLKNELAHVRTQVMTAAAASSQSHSTVNNTVVAGPRTDNVAEAFNEGDAPDDGDFDQSASRGVYAVAAYDAGFWGLVQYLPEQMPDAVVAGYVFSEDGELELYSLVSHGGAGADLEAAQTAGAPPDVSGTYLGGTKRSGFVLTAPALDDDGGVVGALAIRVPGDADLEPADVQDEAVVRVEVMAGSYARLLIDILGEKPRPVPAGKNDR